MLNRNRIRKRGKKMAGSLDDGLTFIYSWDAVRLVHFRPLNHNNNHFTFLEINEREDWCGRYGRLLHRSVNATWRGQCWLGPWDAHERHSMPAWMVWNLLRHQILQGTYVDQGRFWMRHRQIRRAN